MFDISDDSLRLTKVGKKDEQGNWTDETKVEVVTQYLALGNMRAVSRNTGVAFQTIIKWREQEWWEKLVSEIKNARKTEVSSKLNRIIDSAIEKVADRLENGDFILNNKTGEIVRKPVSMKETATVLKDVIDRQIKLEKEVQETTTTQQSVPELLKTLAAEFAKYNKKQSATDIPFVEVVDAVHDKRET